MEEIKRNGLALKDTSFSLPLPLLRSAVNQICPGETEKKHLIHEQFLSDEYITEIDRVDGTTNIYQHFKVYCSSYDFGQ